jgi:hypothetical protein
MAYNYGNKKRIGNKNIVTKYDAILWGAHAPRRGAAEV